MDEARNTLDNLEGKILSLENREDMALVDEIFRGLHSMKGVASFLQLTSIQKLAHHLESVIDSIRQGRTNASPKLVNDCLARVDILGSLVGELVEKLQNKKPLADGTFEFELQDWDEEEPKDVLVETENDAEAKLALTPEFRISFQKESLELLEDLEHALLELEKNPESGEGLHLTFRLMHSFKGNCGFFGFAEMERLAHHLESFMETFRPAHVQEAHGFFEIGFKYLDAFRRGCADIAAGGTGRIEGFEGLLRDIELLSASPTEGVKPIGQILLENGQINSDDLDEALQQQKRRLGQILLDQGKVSPDGLEAALQKQQESLSNSAPIVRAPAGGAESRKDLRVDVTKLDFLLDLVGELVISSGIVANHPDIQGVHHESFDKASRHMAGIVNDVQKVVLGLRMVPIEIVFKKMIRLVHDQSIKSGKSVQLELRGEKTEVDKNIAELIADPLVHMIRNAIDHGIESPEDRQRAGKPATGIVILEAKQEGSDISILLSDDGKGLDRERILNKAVEKGLLKPNHGELKDDEVFQFIFAPGFSTAERLTATSGRGVGMDVVKSNIEKLKGKILIDSRQGRGTNIDLRLPLTLSIIDGMQVRVGEGQFIIPMIAIKETLSPARDKITRTGPGQELFLLRGKLYPILRLDKLYGIKGARAELGGGVLLLIEARGASYCLLVDEIVGMRQTVVKSLPPFLGNIIGSSGCSILVNGEICLILDVEALPGGMQAQLESAAPGDMNATPSWVRGEEKAVNA